MHVIIVTSSTRQFCVIINSKRLKYVSVFLRWNCILQDFPKNNIPLNRQQVELFICHLQDIFACVYTYIYNFTVYKVHVHSTSVVHSSYKWVLSLLYQNIFCCSTAYKICNLEQIISYFSISIFFIFKMQKIIFSSIFINIS